MTYRLIDKDYSLAKRIIICFLLLQPLLDLLTSLSVRYSNLEILSYGVVFRTIFMMGMGVYVFSQKGKDFKVAKTYYIILGIYLLMFLTRIYLIGDSALITLEIKSLIKTFYYPIILVGLWLINKNEDLIENNNLFKAILAQYLIIIFLAVITGTSYDSYSSGFGSVGWFYAANEKGSIIAMLIPFLFLPLLLKKWNFINIILFFLMVFSVFYVGTKVPPMSLIVFLMGMIMVAIFKLIYKETNWVKNFSKVFTFTLLLCLVMSVRSPLAKNLAANYGQFFYGQHKLITGQISEEEFEKQKLDQIIEQTILSSRNIYRDFVRESYDQSDLSGKLLGIGYHIRDKEGGITNKTIEMDFYDIYFRHGVLGSIVYFSPTVLIFIYLLRLFFKDFRKNSTSYLMVSLCFSVLIGLGISMLTGHVLTSPGVSIFMAVMITTLYSVLKGKPYKIE